MTDLTDMEPQRYTVERLLASGGHGQLYLGRDRLTGTPVAIKRLKREAIARNPDLIGRFEREAETLRRLRHPNIVRMLATEEQDDEQWLVMEYVSGGSLRERLERGPMSVAEALKIAVELADALARAHHVGVVHRDLKPENVVLAGDGTPRLTDFGVARLLRDDVRLTQSGTLIGSPAYMSPEALGGQELDARSDIWSLGVLLYEMLTGTRPFPGDQLTGVMIAILHQPVPDITESIPDVPLSLVVLLSQMLEKERSRRLGSMRQVAASLEAILAGRPAPVSATTALETVTPGTESAAELQAATWPRAATTFVGRERELAEVSAMLARADTRLLTILGPGGIGKTRLALATGDRVRTSFADGAAFVSLAPLTDAENVVAAVAESVGLRFHSVGSLEQELLEYLQPKQMLLVLDNFEHVLQSAAFIGRLLTQAPGVRLLVTSRERLNLSGETVYTLTGLAFVDEEPPLLTPVKQDVIASDAARLLLQEIQRVRPGYVPQAADHEYIYTICRLVEGMPLALVLAASWLDVLSLREVAEEISRSIDFLQTDLRDLPPRQQSMRAVFEASWVRLHPEEQDAFMRLSVFRGGFSREAAATVAGAGLRPLRSLVNKSFLTVDNRRYEVHELMRQFGEEKLAEGGLVAEARDAHSGYYLQQLAVRELDLKGRRQAEALQEIYSDFENVRAAWLHALEMSHVEQMITALEALYLAFYMRSRLQEGAALLRRALRALPEAEQPFRRRLLVRLGLLQSYFLSAREDIGEFVPVVQAVTREPGPAREVALAHLLLGCYHLLALRSYEPALTHFRESRDRFEALEDGFYLAWVLHRLGITYGNMAHLEEFESYTQRSFEVARAQGDLLNMCVALGNLTTGAIIVGQFAQAERFGAEALVLAEQMHLPLTVAHATTQLSLVQFMKGHLEDAYSSAMEALALAEEINFTSSLAQAPAVLSLIAALKGVYHESERRAQQSLAVEVNNTWGIMLANWGLCLTACGQDPAGDGRVRVRALLQLALQMRMTSPLTWFLPAGAIVLAAMGDAEHATELLALSASHPLSPTGWHAHWSVLGELRRQLRAQLGPAAYRRAWDRGAAAEPAAAASQFLQLTASEAT